MAEYIEREKAIKETINSIVEVLNIHNSVPLIKITCKMREFPTADVVEVVRCKDCVYCGEHYNICHYGVGRDVKPDHYCGYGERRCEE
jgi:hypothetical protein